MQSSDLIFLLTSEDFMNNSYFGIRQYLNIIRLKAIESNRNIVKCSSGGISAVINEKGDVLEKLQANFRMSTLSELVNQAFLRKLVVLSFGVGNKLYSVN